MIVRCLFHQEREIKRLVNLLPEKDRPDLEELLALTPDVARNAIDELRRLAQKHNDIV